MVRMITKRHQPISSQAFAGTSAKAGRLSADIPKPERSSEQCLKGIVYIVCCMWVCIRFSLLREVRAWLYEANVCVLAQHWFCLFHIFLHHYLRRNSISPWSTPTPTPTEHYRPTVMTATAHQWYMLHPNEVNKSLWLYGKAQKC